MLDGYSVAAKYTSPNQQRQPLPSLLHLSFVYSMFVTLFTISEEPRCKVWYVKIL